MGEWLLPWRNGVSRTGSTGLEKANTFPWHSGNSGAAVPPRGGQHATGQAGMPNTLLDALDVEG